MKNMRGSKLAVFTLLTVLTILLTSTVSATFYKLDPCRVAPANTTLANFTIVINSTYNQTILLNLTESCDNTLFVQSTNQNLSNNPTAQLVALYYYNNALWFENISNITNTSMRPWWENTWNGSYNVTWLREQFDAWKNYYNLAEANAQFATLADMNLVKTDIAAIKPRIDVLEAEENSPFGIWWKILLVATFVLALLAAVVAYMAKTIASQVVPQY